VPSSWRSTRLTDAVVFVLSIGTALGLWELVSRSGAVSQRDLPAMSTTLDELWSERG
jgi:ABC-type nitrate/sulfonate/bicarbonate transport system permease component